MVVDVLVFVVIAVLIVAVALACFAAWVGISLMRAAGRLVGSLGRWMLGEGAGARVVMRRCERGVCGQLNPTEARFCRRCGRALAAERRSEVVVGRLEAEREGLGV